MLHMYRDVKKTAYTQTKQKSQSIHKTNTNTRKPHRPEFGGVTFQFWMPAAAATFSLVCALLESGIPGPASRAGSFHRKIKKKKQTSKTNNA